MGKRVLLANEAGTGRGHVTTLKVVAQALGPDYTYDAALCLMDHASDIAPLCDMVFRGAALGYQPDAMAARQGRRIGNWAEFLACIGFADEEFLVRQIDWWVRTIQARQSTLVVAEFAPCAMLAARALGVPVISIGQGHSTPPAGMARYPAPADGIAALMVDEADLVDILNRAGKHFGLLPHRYFSDLYRCDAQLMRTIPALDPYAAFRVNPTYLPPMGLDCPEAASGDEIFVYFSTVEGDDPAIVEAIASIDLPMRVVMARIEPDLAERLSARGAIIEPAPLPHHQIAARSRMIVHAGQHGASSIGLSLGLPHVALPCQSEQTANARCLADMGVGITFEQPRSDAPAIAAAIRQVYADDAMARQARDLSRSLRPVLVGDTPALVRATVDAIFARRAVA